MTQNTLREKALTLLSRRNADIGVGFYLRQSAVRHILFSGMFFVLIAIAWWAEVPPAAYIAGGVWAGRLIRDIQWYQRLASEWKTSREFIDSPKVERIAA